MSKIAITLATACFTGLVSCYYPPAPPPPGYRPHRPNTPPSVSPYGGDVDISPPPPSRPTRPDRPDPPGVSVTGNYPTGERTDRPDQVISPYDPYNVIDLNVIESSGATRLLKSGELARDPSNMKIFRVP